MIAEENRPMPSRHVEADNAADAIMARLVLTCLTEDDAASAITANELGDCSGCWTQIATAAIWRLSELMRNIHGYDGAVQHLEHAIAQALDASETA